MNGMSTSYGCYIRKQLRNVHGTNSENHFHFHFHPSFTLHRFDCCLSWINASPGWKATTNDLQNNSPFNSIFYPLDFNLPNTFHLYFAWFFLKCVGQHNNKEWECRYVSNGLDLTTGVTIIMRAVESIVAMKMH